MTEQGSKMVSRWRRIQWLYVARWVVASIVTVLAMAVITRAVVVMLRPEKLQLKLAGGHVGFRPIPSLPPPGNIVTFRFELSAAYNPSRRASFLYSNVTVRLTEASYSLSSSSPAPAARIFEFNLPKAIAVSQQTVHEAFVTVELEPEEDMPMRYVRALYEGRAVAGAEMELSGLLSSKVRMATTTTTVRATYYCWPVRMAVGPADYGVADVPCFDKSDTPFHV